MGINALADRLRLSGAFITNEVNKLVSDGLIEKSTHPSDGRRVQLAVTEIRRFTFIRRFRPKSLAWVSPAPREDRSF